MLQNSKEFKIDLNAKTNNGETAFYLACASGHIKIVEMIIDNAKFLKMDLMSKNNNGSTGFQIAKNLGHADIVSIIEKKTAKRLFPLHI